ncbi:hypothetical protein REPUB_Repub07fG0148400 [Reevesia pubescens]
MCYPNLIQFFPLVVSYVDGLPSGSEIASDVLQPLHNFLAIAFDQTRDQVEAILRTINPDMVFYDLGHWIPTLAQQIGIKSIYHVVVSAIANADIMEIKTKEMTVEELIEVPPGFPSSKVKLKAEEAGLVSTI